MNITKFGKQKNIKKVTQKCPSFANSLFIRVLITKIFIPLNVCRFLLALNVHYDVLLVKFLATSSVIF